MRHGNDFAGEILPFGCYVEYYPSNPDLIDEHHTFEAKTREGIFMGYVQTSHGYFTGDYWVLDHNDKLDVATGSKGSIRDLTLQRV